MTLIETRPVLAELSPVGTAVERGAWWVVGASRTLRGCESVDAVMATVAELARSVTGCQAVSLIGVKPRARVRTVSPTHELALACVQAQAAVFTARASTPAWQAALSGLCEVALAEPVGDDIALAVFLPRGAGRHPAALVLGFDADRAPDPELLTTCQTLAELADSAAAYQHAEDQVDSLLTALDNSREIGTAIGILMATRHVDADQAFAVLREASQRTHRKVNAIAAEVVYTGMLPD